MVEFVKAGLQKLVVETRLDSCSWMRKKVSVGVCSAEEAE